MVKSRTIEIDGVGSVLFERSTKAKNMNITVKPFTGVRVAVPKGLSFKVAEEHVRSKTAWIEKQQARMKEYEQQATSDVAAEIDRGQAKRKLKQRLRYLAEKHGYTYNCVFIRNQRTRWGSCSPNNNISLNMKLVKLPDELRDYIILHELVHTRFKNHGNDFWAELEKRVVNAKGVGMRLRGYGVGVV